MASSICKAVSLVGVLPLVVCLCSQARAEPANDESTRAAAEARLVEGVARLRSGDYAGALTDFQKAYGLVPSPNIHYDLGLAYAGLGRSAEALDAFERFIADAPGAPAATRRKAKLDAATMRSRVAAANVSSDPPGAEILVDGVPRGVTPLPRPLYLDPGPHEIAARATGGVSGPARTVVAEVGATIDLLLAVPGVAAPARPAPTASALAAGPAAEPGPSALVERPANTPTTANSSARVWALSSTALGVALLGAGVTFGLLARREGDRLTELSQQSTPMNRPDFPPSTESRGHTYDTLATISVVGGLVALAAGVTIYLAGERGKSPGPGLRF